MSIILPASFCHPHHEAITWLIEADIVASIAPSGTGETDSSSESEVDRIRTKVAANSGVGTRPATSLTEGKGSGVQFAFEVSGSYESTKDEKFDLKERSSLVSTSVVYRSIDQSHSSEIANSSGDVHFVISLGTEQTGIGFSVNVSDSSTIKGDRIFLEVWSPGENPPTEYEVFFGTRRDFSEGESQSSFSFGLALGVDATGDPGDALHSEVEESGFGESDLTLVARVENYLTNAGHVYPYVERTYQRSEGKFRSGIGIEQVHQTGSAELQYSEVGTQSLPDVPPIVLVDVQPGAQDLESLLNEYRDRATRIARWQAMVDDPNTDPTMVSYLKGLIESEQATLDTMARNAKNAGVSEQELQQIRNEANEAAENDPINLQTLDNFNDVYDDSTAPGYRYFLSNPSAMDEGWLRNGQYIAIGTAAVAGGAAIALKAAAVYGISQIGVVGLTSLKSQIILEYQLIAAVTPGPLGLTQQISRATGMTPAAAGEYFGWAGRIVTKDATMFSKADLVARGFTRPVLQNMAWIYQRVTQLTPANPSAASRTQQLREILDLLFK